MWKRLAVVAAASIAVMGGTVVSAGLAGAAENPDGPAVSVPAEQGIVTVTDDTQPSQDPCVPAPLALGNTVQNTAAAFTLRITISAPLCEPVQAAAVVYAMPGNGVAWPQTLVERTDFTLKDPGVVTIRFDKACDPVQFDVITGASPKVISPDGAWHGPLLFPTDVATALQYWGDGPGCSTTTSTTALPPAPPTSPSTTSSTTTPTVLPTTTEQTTTTAAVAGATTINTTPPTTGAAVAGISATNGASTGGSSLAFTGSGNGDLTRLGLVLLVVGLGLGLLARRRRTAAPVAD